jgi:hypothetical protein
LAGRFVAWDCRGFCAGTKATQSLHVIDLRSGRTRSVDTVAAKVGVTTQGALVWLRSDGAAGATIRVLDVRGERTIDSGDVDKTFLKVFSTFVLWRKGGENQWVDLAG